MGYQPRPCGVCGTEFVGPPKKLYCSPSCAKKKMEEQLQALAEKRKASRPGKRCPACGHLLKENR